MRVGAVIGILSLLSVQIPALIKKAQEKKPDMLRETKEGLLMLRGEKGLMALLLLGAMYAVIFMPIGTLYPLISMTYFGGTFRESSIVEIAFAAGTLSGSVLLGIIGNRIGKIKAIALSIAGMGIGLTATGLLPPGGSGLYGACRFYGIYDTFLLGHADGDFPDADRAGIPGQDHVTVHQCADGGDADRAHPVRNVC